MRTPILLGALAAAPLLAPAPAAQSTTDGLEAAIDRYEECLRRLPLLMHTRGRERLAQTREVEALEMLAKSYARPTAPEEQVRHLLVGICARYFTGQQHLERWNEWREDHDDAADAYLWYRGLTVLARLEGPEAVAEVAIGRHDVRLRAAAIRALAAGSNAAIDELMLEVCADMPRKDAEKAVLVAALGHALLRRKPLLGDAAVQRAAKAYAGLLADDAKLPETAEKTVARYLGDLLDIERLFTQPEAWIPRIEARAAAAGTGPKPSSGGATSSKRPTFFGLEATGDRIVYVIDMSDSMCKEIDPAIKPAGPITGGDEPKRDDDDLPTENDIPWHLVENRFDLAREHLKLSLRRLPEEKQFAVVFFGDEAALLDACPGMLPAKRRNVQKVIDELDAIETGPATSHRPDGTLRGKTNLHGGLRRAFQVRKKGLADEDEYVDAKALLEGADTIFVLSDGDPTWDDWDQPDKNYREDTLGDPESRIAHPDAPMVHYHGPYVYPEHLLDDLERLTLFRAVEIHCIGIGEASMGLLDAISRQGLGGKTHRFGG